MSAQRLVTVQPDHVSDCSDPLHPISEARCGFFSPILPPAALSAVAADPLRVAEGPGGASELVKHLIAADR